MRRIDGALGAAVLLFVVYALTLAPDVTFWDAGEFIAATRSLGIPHPPGTPLFILLEHVWARLLFFLPYAVATNLFSATATAMAAGLTGRLVWRATASGAMAFAATVAAGGMSSVWLNATETEVYAASLALGVLTIWAGDRAGRLDDDRWALLTAYLIVLGVPLHLSALLAAPVAIFFASYVSGEIRWRRAVVLFGAFVAAVGVGRVSGTIATAGALVIMAATLMPPPSGRWSARVSLPLATLVSAAVAASALAFLYIRAQFDPGINQGNPETFTALADVIARRQYAVSPMWPREAPIWLQVANLGQYFDWQVALSFGPTVMPSIARTVGTVFFAWLGWEGAFELWRRDRRAGMAMALLFLCGAFGVLVYLNLHAGPSIGFGFLAEKLVREARERDYFFVFGFWAWGVWAGIGAVAVLSRWRRPAWTGALLACLPLALNWRAVTRRAQPEASLPRMFAEALLESAPRRAVMFVGGDNDTYPLWFAQQVLGIRRDVTLVTVPLLPTFWYRAELARRDFLLTQNQVDSYRGTLAVAADVAGGARRLGRPVAASIALTPRERDQIGANWIPSGFVFVEGGTVNTLAARRWSDWVRANMPAGEVRQAIDPVQSYFRGLLDCPRQLAQAARGADSVRLDSACNYR
ncbi:MAG TPA: DUF2723 domain-containing protein [Gemmatimonadaceae bacterium]|nr:DUF2723 domain-containing protein [Gemmatimonadaceae bacterium]